jgi:hypothetical protein
MTNPKSGLDLPNLSDDLAAMTVGEFEAWFSGVPFGEYRSASAEERLDVEQLDAYRTLARLRRGLIREQVVLSALHPEDATASSARIDRIESEIHELEDFLRSVDWDIDVQDDES